MPALGKLSASSWVQLSDRNGVGFSTEDFTQSINRGSSLVVRFCATFVDSTGNEAAGLKLRMRNMKDASDVYMIGDLSQPCSDTGLVHHECKFI